MEGQLARDWISVGGGFGPEDSDALIASFMRNASIAADFLCFAIPDVALGPGGGRVVEQLYIVFDSHPGGAEYALRQVSDDENGTRLFSVSSDWLTAEYVDAQSGPWSLLATLCEILVSLQRENEIDLPALPRPLRGDG